MSEVNKRDSQETKTSQPVDNKTTYLSELKTILLKEVTKVAHNAVNNREPLGILDKVRADNTKLSRLKKEILNLKQRFQGLPSKRRNQVIVGLSAIILLSFIFSGEDEKTISKSKIAAVDITALINSSSSQESLTLKKSSNLELSSDEASRSANIAKVAEKDAIENPVPPLIMPKQEGVTPELAQTTSKEVQKEESLIPNLKAEDLILERQSSSITSLRGPLLALSPAMIDKKIELEAVDIEYEDLLNDTEIETFEKDLEKSDM